MKLKIKVNDANYFYTLLSLLKDIKPFSELRNRELEVLARILTYNYKYRDIPRAERMAIIFNYDKRLEMAEDMGITRETFYNLTKRLRDKGILDLKGIAGNYDKVLTRYNSLKFEFEFEDVNE